MISYYKHGMTVIIRDQKLILMYDRLKGSYQLVGHKQYNTLHRIATAYQDNHRAPVDFIYQIKIAAC